MANSPVCSIPGCNNPRRGRGYCTAHYLRWYRYGDPLAGRTPMGAPQKWIDDHADVESDDCLIWPFSRNLYGYGQINISGTPVGVHRIMCERANGAAPSDKHEAAHSCGNGHLGCVQPKHLRWATSAENSADTYAHGTINRGVKNGSAVLSEDQVREIRANRHLLSERKLAAAYGVSRSTVSDIIHRRNWAWLR